MGVSQLWKPEMRSELKRPSDTLTLEQVRKYTAVRNGEQGASSVFGSPNSPIVRLLNAEERIASLAIGSSDPHAIYASAAIATSGAEHLRETLAELYLQFRLAPDRACAEQMVSAWESANQRAAVVPRSR